MSNEIKQETADILVSVVVPVYNVEAFLRQCVDSLLAQTHTNLEIILVDDGSTDNSGAICDEYAVRSSNIRVIHKENGGLSSARNAGIAAAKGAYIGFVDSDDYVESDMYALLLDAAVAQDAQIAACARYLTDEAGCVTGIKYELSTPKAYTMQQSAKEILTFGELDVAAWDKLFKKELFEGIEFPVGEINEDAAIIFKILSRVNKLVHVGKPLYYYRGRSGSITKSGYKPNKLQALEHAQEIERFLCGKDPAFKPYCREYTAYLCCQLLCLMLKDPLARKQYPEHYSRYMTGLRANIRYLYSNRNIGLKWKLRGTMVFSGVYSVLYGVLKREKT